MSGVGTGTALIIGATVAAGATMAASSMAADAQSSAAREASQAQLAMFGTVQQKLAPYVETGAAASNKLMGNLDSLTAPIVMDQAELAKTPGYQFALNQGLQSAQNSAAARGLGSSGAALKGAESYATGLASQTYQQQFENAVTNQSNAFNRLMSVSSLGENAAAEVGNAAVATGQGLASNSIGAGNAQAAAYNASGAAVGNIGTAFAGGYGGYGGLAAGASKINPVSGGRA